MAKMFKSYKPTSIGRMLETIDFYLCEVYDFLWGKRIYEICSRKYAEERKFTTAEWMAVNLAEWLPPISSNVTHYFKKILWRRRIQRMEFKAFGKEIHWSK